MVASLQGNGGRRHLRFARHRHTSCLAVERDAEYLRLRCFISIGTVASASPLRRFHIESFQVMRRVPDQTRPASKTFMASSRSVGSGSSMILSVESMLITGRVSRL